MIPTADVRPEDLINRTDAAKLLKIHVNTLDRAVREGGLRRFRRRDDRRVFFLREEIQGIELIVEVTDDA
jgi:predicted site-specific integrase-resolvase